MPESFCPYNLPGGVRAPHSWRETTFSILNPTLAPGFPALPVPLGCRPVWDYMGLSVDSPRAGAAGSMCLRWAWGHGSDSGWDVAPAPAPSRAGSPHSWLSTVHAFWVGDGAFLTSSSLAFGKCADSRQSINTDIW